MDDIDGRLTHTIPSAADTTNEIIGNTDKNFIVSTSSGSGSRSNSKDEKKRLCVSLPMYYDHVSVADKIL